MRKCRDDNSKEIELRYNAGKMQDDDDNIILCIECSEKFPFNQEVLSKIEIKKDVEFPPKNPDPKTPDFEKGVSE